jgi:hypothetical protein
MFGNGAHDPVQPVEGLDRGGGSLTAGDTARIATSTIWRTP